MNARIRMFILIAIISLTLALSACRIEITGGNGCQVAGCTNQPTPVGIVITR